MLPAPPATFSPVGSSAVQPIPVGGFGSTVPVVSGAELLDNERKREDEETINREAVVSSLAAHIRTRWEMAKTAKVEIERKMLAALRQRVGEYSPEKLAEIRKFGGSEVFVKLTDMKCAAAAAWIRDVLSLDRPWGLEPTPVPDLPPEQTAMIEQQAQQQALASIEQQILMGAAIDQAALPAMLEEAAEQAKVAAKQKIEKEARAGAEAMSKVIEDYLNESGFKSSLAQAIDWDLVTFGTAILRAPVIRSRRRLTWQQDDFGRWQPVDSEDTYPDVERVSPLDFYPSDDATSIDDASYSIERYPLSRADLSAFRDQENWNTAEIDAVLTEHGSGGLREWTSADSERAQLAERNDARQQGERIDTLIYHGECQGKMLKEWGIQSVNDLDEYAVEAWLISRHVVRVDIKEPHEIDRPYCKAVYRDRPGSFWGIGVPELMDDIQQQANAAARALANNMAMASGPQVGVDLEQMPPGEDGSKQWPWKVWRFNTGKYGQSATPPIQFFQPDMHAQELMAIYEKWVRIADDVTGIPSYVYGNQDVGGAGKTASGLSMLMGAASKSVKAIIANIDAGLIEPLIQRMFRYVMLYHPDESIKRDCRVVAKGSTALLIREQAQIRRNEFLQTTNNPVDLQIMGLGRRAELLRSTAQTLSLDPDDIAPEREEMEQRQQAMMAQQQAAEAAQLQATPILPDGERQGGQDSRTMTPGG